ncbi:MAG: cyclic nucleotide-binding domain-containing protein [Myxococcota bacterium]|nr:cyclic nucleotide-binding domain-containing protein [Myxococcota bacterium]
MKPEELKRFALLSEFGEEDREHLVELLDAESFAEGSTLFREGDEADALYLLASGSVRVHSETAGRLGLLCEGANLGAISLIVIGKREATAVAESDARLGVLTRAGFLRLADDHPRTACRLAEAIVVDLAGTLRGHLPHLKQQFTSDDVVLSG